MAMVRCWRCLWLMIVGWLRVMASVESRAEARVAENQYDTAAWRVLFKAALEKPIGEARSLYARFFALFPTAASHWAQYADHEVKGTSSSSSSSCLSARLPFLFLFCRLYRFLLLY